MKTVSLAVILFVSLTLLAQFSLGEGKDRGKNKNCKGHCDANSKKRDVKAEKYKKEHQGKYHADDDADDDDDDDYDYDDDDDDENYSKIDKNMRKKAKSDGDRSLKGVSSETIENGVGGKHDRKWIGRKKEFDEKRKHDKNTNESKEKGEFKDKEGKSKQAKDGREKPVSADKADKKKYGRENVDGALKKNPKTADAENEDKTRKNLRKKRSVSDPNADGKDGESTVTENGTEDNENDEENVEITATSETNENEVSQDQPTDGGVEGSDDIISEVSSELNMDLKAGEDNIGEGEPENANESVDKTLIDKPAEEKEVSEDEVSYDHLEAYKPTEEGPDAKADDEGLVATEGEGEDYTRSRWASSTVSPRDELPRVTLEFDSTEMLPEHMWVGKSDVGFEEEEEADLEVLEAGVPGGRRIEVDVSGSREGVEGERGGEGVEGEEKEGVGEGVEEGVGEEGKREGVNGKDETEMLEENGVKTET